MENTTKNHTNKILQHWLADLAVNYESDRKLIPCTSIEQIVRVYNLDSKSRKRELIEQRQALIRYLHFELEWHTTKIGELLKKDRTTIIWAIRKIKEGYCDDLIFLQHTIEIRNSIKFYDKVYKK